MKRSALRRRRRIPAQRQRKHIHRNIENKIVGGNIPKLNMDMTIKVQEAYRTWNELDQESPLTT